MRLANIKLRDVTFLARYAAHIVVLVLTFTVGKMYGVDFSTYLQPQAAYATTADVPAALPWSWDGQVETSSTYLQWDALPQTIIAERPAVARFEPMTYVVQAGDDPSIIAARFGLQPSTIVWSNPQATQDTEAYFLSIGQTLVIPPVDGVVHTVQEGDTLASIAASYEADPSAMLTYPGNHLSDEAAPLIVGQQLTVPGGRVPYVPPPTPVPAPAPVVAAPAPAPAPAPAASSSTSTSTSSASSSNSSTSSYRGASGYLRWPVTGRITTQPSNWHMALDIANSLGTPVVAADGGRVIYAGWDNTGYGYMVMIDHGNGLRTLYAHFSYFSVNYGDYVNKGAVIGKLGSTGHSTGPHLHFEVRQYNRYTWWRVNPWNYLP